MRGKWGLTAGLGIIVVALIAFVIWFAFGRGDTPAPPAASPVPTVTPSTPPTSIPDPVDEEDGAKEAEEPVTNETVPEPTPGPKLPVVHKPTPKPTPPTPTPTPPAALNVALRADTGVSPTDGITNDSRVMISGLQPGATWQYRINAASWQIGSGDGFDLEHGVYDHSVEVRQAYAGLVSEITVLPLVTIDVVAPDPVILEANLVTAHTPSGHTLDGLVNPSNLETDASWQYSFDATVFVDGVTQIGYLPFGPTTITVIQTDLAGNSSVPETSTWWVSNTLILADPDLTVSVIGELFDRYSGFRVEAIHQSNVSQGDAIVNNLDGVLLYGISGKLAVGSAAVAAIDTAVLNEYFAPSAGLLIYASLADTEIDRSGFLHHLEIRASALGGTLIGGDGGNRLVGGNGNDILYGGSGDDELYGSNGINQFYPGVGQNLISFGGTTNTVYYSTAEIESKLVPDRITGYISGLDRINLQIPGLSAGPLTSFVDDRAKVPLCCFPASESG